MRTDATLYRLTWVAAVAGGVLGLVGVVVLVRGDPTYLVQPRTRGGAPTGPPAPVSFPWRAFNSLLLGGGLTVAGRRAVTDAGAGVRVPGLVGYALFLADAA